MRPLPRRAAVGNRARGLQRQRPSLGLLHARPGPLASVSLGRGRHRGDLRRSADALLRARILERARSHSEGTSLRTDQQREQSRRGVKEYYYYLDSTPTHSYMKYLYKYPQAPYPHDEIVATSRSRGRHEPEYELIDTGVFADDRGLSVTDEKYRIVPGSPLVRRHDDDDLCAAPRLRASMEARGPDPHGQLIAHGDASWWRGRAGSIRSAATKRKPLPPRICS